MRISDWSSDVCSSDLGPVLRHRRPARSIACPAYAPLYGREIRSRPHRRQLLPIAQEAFERRRHARSSIPRPPRRSGDQGPASPSPWLSDKPPPDASGKRSEEHTYELTSLMRISYAVLRVKNKQHNTYTHQT